MRKEGSGDPGRAAGIAAIVSEGPSDAATSTSMSVSVAASASTTPAWMEPASTRAGRASRHLFLASGARSRARNAEGKAGVGSRRPCARKASTPRARDDGLADERRAVIEGSASPTSPALGSVARAAGAVRGVVGESSSLSVPALEGTEGNEAPDMPRRTALRVGASSESRSLNRPSATVESSNLQTGLPLGPLRPTVAQQRVARPGVVPRDGAGVRQGLADAPLGDVQHARPLQLRPRVRCRHADIQHHAQQVGGGRACRGVLFGQPLLEHRQRPKCVLRGRLLEQRLGGRLCRGRNQLLCCGRQLEQRGQHGFDVGGEVPPRGQRRHGGQRGECERRAQRHGGRAHGVGRDPHSFGPFLWFLPRGAARRQPAERFQRRVARVPVGLALLRRKLRSERGKERRERRVGRRGRPRPALHGAVQAREFAALLLVSTVRGKSYSRRLEPIADSAKISAPIPRNSGFADALPACFRLPPPTPSDPRQTPVPHPDVQERLGDQLCRGLPHGRRVGGRLQDRRSPHREGEAADTEPGRDDQAGEAGQAVQGDHGVLHADDQERGLPVALARQPRQRDPLLPHAGPQLRLQGQVQAHVRLQQGPRRLLEVVRRQPRLWRRRGRHLPALRLLARLRAHAAGQRRQIRQKGRRRQAVLGAVRRVQEDPRLGRPRGALQGVRRQLRGDRDLPRAVLWRVRLAQAGTADGEPGGELPRGVHAGVERDHRRGAGELPARHGQEADDDDLGRGGQVPFLVGLPDPGGPQRGRLVAVQGRGGQHPPRRRGGGRAGGVRPAADDHVGEKVRGGWSLRGRLGSRIGSWEARWHRRWTARRTLFLGAGRWRLLGSRWNSIDLCLA